MTKTSSLPTGSTPWICQAYSAAHCARMQRYVIAEVVFGELRIWNFRQQRNQGKTLDSGHMKPDRLCITECDGDQAIPPRIDCDLQ